MAATGDASIAALLERVAFERANEAFVIEPESGREVTFAEARNGAAAIAALLRRRGLAKGERVGLAMDNGAAAVAAHLGAMCGGFVPVPLDGNAGALHLDHILRQTGARLILAHGKRGASLEPAAARAGVECISVTAGEPLEESTFAGVAPAPNDDALLMYTSGSTGHPKGVVVSHAGLIARAAERARAHALRPDDRLLSVLPLHHMNAHNMMLGVLFSGGSLVMPAQFKVAAYWEWAMRHRCTWLSIVPTIVAQLLRWGEGNAWPQPGDLRELRFARCSSAPLSDAMHRAFEERFGILLVQGMGMTEAGGIFVNPPTRAQRRIGALGLSHGLEVKLVGADGRVLGRGQTGELFVRGDALMSRYFDDPAATAAAIDAKGWLRTGDLCRRDDDGYYFHAGRSKDLIIKAGVNVSPQEIDEAMASHPAVAQAVCVGVPHADLGEDIGAFVVLRSGCSCSETELLAHCEARLGELKTPSWMVAVDSLPAGPTGKVRRAELAARGAAEVAARYGTRAALAPAAARIAPRTPLEREVAAVWMQILGCESIGVDDHFFAAGGSSLLALQLTTRLRQSLGVQLSLGAILAAPTIATQAVRIERQLRVGEPPESDSDTDSGSTLLAPIDAARADTPLFCVHDIARFQRLATLLGPLQPLYGVAVGPAIRAIADDQPISNFAHYDVEQLATTCLPEIRRHQPRGPYRIAGFSFGGRIALEVAQQLRRAGEEVELLVILDTFLPGTFRRTASSRFGRHLAELRRSGPRYLVTAARRRWSLPLPFPEDDLEAGGDSLDERYAEFRNRLRRRYRPQPFPGTIVLFRAMRRDDISEFIVEPNLGWTSIATGQLHVHDVPGTHLEILDEIGSPIIADRLREHFARLSRSKVPGPRSGIR